MEASQVNISYGLENVAVSVGISDQLIETSAAMGPTVALNSEFRSDVMVATSKNNYQSNPGDQHLQDFSVHPGGVQVPASNTGVSNCYVFKSRLQEYAQKVGFSTPVYETIKEGPSHEPSFRSAVIVGGERYESMPGFFNRKAAEQSAAEVALVELSKCGEKTASIAAPVHETGLCKNLLQEYAQKMNYAIPNYICQKYDTPGRHPLFSCTVEIGGIQYIGATARTKKEAEIRAARTALLAIRSSDTIGGQYSVIPGKRKMPETALPKVETVKEKKRKKPRFKKKRKTLDQTQSGILGILVGNDMSAPVSIQVPKHGLMHAYKASSDLDNRLKNNQLNGETSVVISDCGPQVGVTESSQIQQTTFSGQCDEHINPSSVECSVPLADANRTQEENNDQGVGYSIPEKAPLSGRLESLPADSCIKSEDPANLLKGEKSTNALSD